MDGETLVQMDGSSWGLYIDGFFYFNLWCVIYIARFQAWIYKLSFLCNAASLD